MPADGISLPLKEGGDLGTSRWGRLEGKATSTTRSAEWSMTARNRPATMAAIRSLLGGKPTSSNDVASFCFKLRADHDPAHPRDLLRGRLEPCHHHGRHDAAA